MAGDGAFERLRMSIEALTKAEQDLARIMPRSGAGGVPGQMDFPGGFGPDQGNFMGPVVPRHARAQIELNANRQDLSVSETRKLFSGGGSFGNPVQATGPNFAQVKEGFGAITQMQQMGVDAMKTAMSPYTQGITNFGQKSSTTDSSAQFIARNQYEERIRGIQLESQVMEDVELRTGPDFRAQQEIARARQIRGVRIQESDAFDPRDRAESEFRQRTSGFFSSGAGESKEDRQMLADLWRQIYKQQSSLQNQDKWLRSRDQMLSESAPGGGMPNKQ